MMLVVSRTGFRTITSREGSFGRVFDGKGPGRAFSSAEVKAMRIPAEARILYSSEIAFEEMR
jgi:hypothetical protein